MSLAKDGELSGDGGEGQQRLNIQLMNAWVPVALLRRHCTVHVLRYSSLIGLTHNPAFAFYILSS